MSSLRDYPRDQCPYERRDSHVRRVQRKKESKPGSQARKGNLSEGMRGRLALKESQRHPFLMVLVESFRVPPPARVEL